MLAKHTLSLARTETTMKFFYLLLVLTSSSLAQGCSMRDDCLASQVGYECVDGRCGCLSTNHDCPAGNFCSEKRCLLTGKYCNTDKECARSNKGHTCQQGMCVCLSNSDCNEDYKCVEKECMREKNPRKRSTGHHDMWVPGGQDVEEVEVPEMLPRGWEETLSCVSSLDCGEAVGGSCIAGLCGCTTQEDCRGGTVCVDSECVNM